MRGAWLVLGLLALGACSGDDATDTQSSGDSGKAVKLDLCEEYDIPQYDSLNCDNVRDLWAEVHQAGEFCEVDEDCRLTSGYCVQGLQGLQQIAVNRCLSDAEVARYGTAAAGCFKRIKCNQVEIVGAECEFGKCVEIVGSR